MLEWSVFGKPYLRAEALEAAWGSNLFSFIIACCVTFGQLRCPSLSSTFFICEIGVILFPFGIKITNVKNLVKNLAHFKSL